MDTGLLVGIVVGTIAAVMTVAGLMADREGLAGQGRRASIRRELMRMPATPIAAVKNGDRVRIQGQVLARGPLRTSPVSEIPCVGFRLAVDAGQQSPSQRVLEQEEFDAVVVIADGTGEAALHAPFKLELDPYDARSENVPQVVVDLAKQTGASLTMFGVLGQVAYVETVLKPGDTIMAVGRATVEVDPASRAATHREPPLICRLEGGHEPVVIADAEAPDGVG